MDWNACASRLIKVELKKRNIKYSELATKLNAAGINESTNTISQKLTRGSFGATFLLQCLYVLNIKQLNIQEYFEAMSQESK